MIKIRNTVKLISMLFLVTVLIASNVPAAYAYGNQDTASTKIPPDGGAHRFLNKLALNKFAEKAKTDPILKNYNFFPSKESLSIECLNSLDDWDGEWSKNLFKCRGSDVINVGQTVKDLKSIEGFNTKTFADWIIDGGFSADEPEKFMAWRHFYNPVLGKGEAYLTDVPTDSGTLQELEIFMGEPNPKIDAKMWALTHNDNPYNWSNGINNLNKMFTQESKDSGYALTWRSIGQTMHLLADMTVPSHVRNDSHPAPEYGYIIFNDLRADPYETIVSKNLSIIDKYKDFQISNKVLDSNIDAAASPGHLFSLIAEYVNANFFSADTIPCVDWHGNIKDLNSDGYVFDCPTYTSNDIKYGYYTVKDDLGDLEMFHKSWLESNAWTDDPTGIVNNTVVDSQAKRLIPIAIKAGVKLLDLSIPRVSVDNIAFDKEKLTGRITRYIANEDGTYTPGEAVNSIVRMVAFVTKAEGGVEENFLLKPVTVENGIFTLKMNELAEYSILNAKKYIEEDVPINISLGLDMGGILVNSSPGIQRDHNPFLESTAVSDEIYPQPSNWADLD